MLIANFSVVYNPLRLSIGGRGERNDANIEGSRLGVEGLFYQKGFGC